MKYNMKKNLVIMITAGILAAVLAGCVSAPAETEAQSVSASKAETEAQSVSASKAETATQGAATAETAAPETTSVRIITTSDMHGKMVPWEYLTNEAAPNGSLAQVASVVKEFRTENTILVDVGDVIQDNSAELFLEEPVHPMILGMNRIGYDVCTLGNHEFNYGMDNVKKVIRSFQAEVLLSNVYDPSGNRLAAPYTILEKGGVKVAVIGAVTPCITRWDKKNLEGYTVTDPVTEVRQAIDEIGGRADVIIVIAHMDENTEMGLSGSGAAEIAAAFPEIDLICAAHGHNEIFGKEVSGSPLLENMAMAETVMITDIALTKKDGKWQSEDTVTERIHTADYEPDREITELLSPFDKAAREDASRPIGTLSGGPLAEKNAIEGIPRALIEDTALLDLQGEVLRYYSGADVSAAILTRKDSNIPEGEIHKSDVSLIYRYENTLDKMKMTGKQLKQWMEWSAALYRQSSPGDLTIAFGEKRRFYNLDVFGGVNYEINISRPEGERIENLTWPDGRPVKDDDVFTVAVNNYRVDSALTAPGEIYASEDEMPELLETEICGNIGTIRALICDYIINVKHGVITPEKAGNWKITGFTPDEEKQEKINELIKAGKLELTSRESGRIFNAEPITEEMLKGLSE